MAEQGKFTAGPWKVAGATLVYGNTGTVCSCGEPRASDLVEYKEMHIGSADFHEACANARLIAAAPELLAALEEMTAIYRDDLAVKDEPTCIQRALAAIAKTTIPGANDVR